MDVKIETKMVVQTTAHFHKGKLKTKPCDLQDWYGGETSRELDFNLLIEKVSLPEGEYKITITLEKVNE